MTPPPTTEVIRLERRRRWMGQGVSEIALAVTAVLLYFAVRGLTETSLVKAQVNSRRVVQFEGWFGLNFEADLQRHVIEHDWLVTLLNWIYIYGHWPVIAVVAMWLLFRHRGEYVVLRNAFLISGAIGLVCFAVFPVAPPRLMEGNALIDTITERSKSYRVLQPPVFVNQYAAMPSLHVGWDLLIGISLVRLAQRVWLRVLGALLPLAMFTATVLTANHYIIDGIAGAAVALLGLFLAYRYRNWAQARALRVARGHPRRSANAPN